MIEQFHFLRPYWLLVLIPLVFFLWHRFNHQAGSRSWQKVVDSALLPYLLSSKGQERQSMLWVVLGTAAGLAIIALAGPVWEKLPQPIFRQQSALVIVLDVSRSMDSSDINPSRLTRARHKVADILKLRSEGQSALIAYAAQAFVVTPLTEDVATINALLPSLSTDIMPSQGSKADKALEQALELFANSGVTNGDILLVSDGFTASELDAMQSLLKNSPQFRVSVLGIGTEEGGPIPLSAGGFLKDEGGAIVISRLDETSMRTVAQSGGGEYQAISTSDDDISGLLKAMQSSPFGTDAVESDLQADIWRELGPWLVLFILPLVALVFRRGVIMLIPLLLLPLPPDAQALGWNELWKNSDQRASEAFEQGEHGTAAELFEQGGWKASSHFRAGDYEAALEQWQDLDHPNAHYNRGNTLAKLGRFEEAIDAYKETLKLDASHEDAAYNKKQIEDLLQQQQQQQDQEQEQSEESEQSQDQQQDSQQSSGQGENQQEQSGDKQQQENQQSSGSESEQDQQATENQSEQQNQPAENEQQSQQESEQMAKMEEQMSEQAAEQWLRKIPDDPGGLLRRKFLYQYRQRDDHSKAQNPW